MDQPKGRVLPVMDRFEEEFGTLPEKQRQRIISVLRGFMKRVRKMQERKQRLMKAVPPEVKGTCSSCAFDPSLGSSKAFPGTAYGLLWSIFHDKLFVCHAGQPGWKEEGQIDCNRLKLCEGFRAVRIFCGTELALEAAQTLEKIQKIAKPSR